MKRQSGEKHADPASAGLCAPVGDERSSLRRAGLVSACIAAFAGWSCQGTIEPLGGGDDAARTSTGQSPGGGGIDGVASASSGGGVNRDVAGAGGGSGAGGAAGGISGGGSGAGSGSDEQCLGTVFQASSAPLRRLSEREYRNTVATLFEGVALPEFELTADDRTGGFSNSAAGQAGSPLVVERYARAAEQISQAAISDPSVWASCPDQTTACASEVVSDFAFRAYRRPLEPQESDRLSEFVEQASAEFGPSEALGMAVQAVLESPFFLYRPEFGSSADIGNAAVALGDYEMASRLSYFFLETMPDPELFAAAAAGELTDPQDIRAHAERLIADSRARPVLTRFFAEWLRLYELEEVSLDPNRFPAFNAALLEDLEASARLYVDKALWEDDSWRVLLTGSYGYVNDRLAPIFGVPAPGTDELVFTELDPGERKGVLTQPGLLAATSHGIRHSPILRGVTLLSNILCAPPPAPPDGILDNIDDEIPDEVCTTRDEVARTHTNGAGCQNCHAMIDGAGFTFEHYDALGRYRTEENGCAIDATGAFPTSDIAGAVQNAVELADKLAESQTVAECVGDHLFRFALGRAGSREDGCEIRALTANLTATDSLQEMLLRMVLTPSFRSRPSPE